jgi:hypothetical protein
VEEDLDEIAIPVQLLVETASPVFAGGIAGDDGLHSRTANLAYEVICVIGGVCQECFAQSMRKQVVG